jgi:hypothetical protein
MSLNKNINMTGGVGSQNRDTKTSQLSINQSKVGAIKSYATKITTARERLASYLLKQNLKLLTSFSEYVETNSFVKSSYIVYLLNDMKKEKLSTFLERNPVFDEIVNEIENELKNQA